MHFFFSTNTLIKLKSCWLSVPQLHDPLSLLELEAQDGLRPDSLGNFSWIQFHLWPPSRQLEPRRHKGLSFTLNVRTPSSPDPYYHNNWPENGSGSGERERASELQLGLPFSLAESVNVCLCVALTRLTHVHTHFTWKVTECVEAHDTARPSSSSASKHNAWT